MGPSLDDQVETRFGRTPYYLFIDPETMEYESIENPNMAAGGGAGIKSAQLMSDHDVQYVLTGNCGPNAFNVFGAAGIQVIVGVNGTVRQAVDQFKAGAFSASNQPNVASHFGMGGGGMGMSAGGGMGMGGGRGMGMGGGRGMGMGGGRGMGMGGGRGMGMGQSGAPMPGTQRQGAAAGNISTLEEEARMLEKQLTDLKRQIDQSKRGGGVARVDAQTCTGCGVCVDHCSFGAITVDGVASIDEDRCTGCGACVDQCPLGAITIV